MCVRVTDSFCCTVRTNTTLWINYTPIKKNKNLFSKYSSILRSWEIGLKHTNFVCFLKYLFIYLFLTLPHSMWRRRQWHPTPVLLPGKSHGQRSLVGCSPWGRKELDMTEQLHFHFSLSCIGEENGNPLQCSFLENPRDGEPGGLLSVGWHRVKHDWSDSAAEKTETVICWGDEGVSKCCSGRHFTISVSN